MDVGEIRDRKSLEAWLNSLPRGTEAEREQAQRWAGIVAHRAAMRVLPYLWVLYLHTLGHLSDPTVVRNHYAGLVLNSLRASLTGATVYNCPAPLVVEAASAVYNKYTPPRDPNSPLSSDAVRTALAGAATAFSDADASASAATTAVAAAVYATSMSVEKNSGAAAAAVWLGIQTDCTALMAGAPIDRVPFWPGGDPLAEYWPSTRLRILAQGPDWRFWVDWYDRALKGEEQDWDLLTKVALIDPKDWKKGADHVNGLIAKIVRDHQTPRAETRPEPPPITEVERSHIQLVLSVREPSRQSAAFLRDRFEVMEQAYRLATACPNETPEELEPIVILARTFGQIERLLRDGRDKDALIIELQAQVAVLKSQNSELVALAKSPKAPIMCDIFVAALGGTLAGLAAPMILASFGFLGGQAVAEGVAPLADLISTAPGPVIDLSPSIPRP